MCAICKLTQKLKLLSWPVCTRLKLPRQSLSARMCVCLHLCVCLYIQLSQNQHGLFYRCSRFSQHSSLQVLTNSSNQLTFPLVIGLGCLLSLWIVSVWTVYLVIPITIHHEPIWCFFFALPPPPNLSCVLFYIDTVLCSPASNKLQHFISKLRFCNIRYFYTFALLWCLLAWYFCKTNIDNKYSSSK